MDPERWRSVQAIFHQVVDQPPVERMSLLKVACHGDTEMFSQVAQLLESETKPGFEVSASFARLFEEDLSSYLGKTFGRYLLKDTLGQGGMGKVFLAERLDYGGAVAFKVLHDALSPERRRRFTAEQKILAQLIHPGIARLYDAGELQDGTPFFVMEYVDGKNVVDYCEALGLSVVQRLELFRRVCETVQFAHRHGVIHRDLKPSNILVDREGAVKLLDFGIAESTGIELDSPESSSLFLTRAYASPEQLRREVTTVQADVYALGVILEEVLRSAPPAGANWMDLHALCGKASDPDQGKRYGSVDALLGDIDRYLSGATLEARRPFGIWYAGSKFARRNARALALAALVLLAMVGLAAFYTVRLTRARNTAEAEAVRASAVQRFMLGLFTGFDQESEPLSDLKLTALIERGEKEIPKLNGQPAVQADLNLTLGSIEKVLGRYDRATALLTEALRQRRQVYGESSPKAAEVMMELGYVSRLCSRFAEAEQWVRKANAIYAAKLSKNDPLLPVGRTSLAALFIAQGKYQDAAPLLEQCLKEQEAASAPLSDLADTINELSIVYFYLGDYSESLRLNHRSLQIDKRLKGEDHPDVAADYITLAQNSKMLDRFEDAEKYSRKALAIYRKWFGEHHTETASAMMNVAQALMGRGKNAEAARMMDTALEVEQSVQPGPHSRTALMLITMGSVKMALAQWDQAESYYLRGLNMCRNIYRRKHYSEGTALARLGRLYALRKQNAKAEKAFREALSIYDETLRPGNNLDIFTAEIDYGKFLVSERHYPEAEKWLLRACAGLKKQKEPSPQRLRHVREALAEVYASIHEPQRAKEFSESLTGPGGL